SNQAEWHCQRSGWAALPAVRLGGTVSGQAWRHAPLVRQGDIASSQAGWNCQWSGWVALPVIRLGGTARGQAGWHAPTIRLCGTDSSQSGWHFVTPSQLSG
ncbi:hypothetical protein LSAT2_028034, partial [Lamellibrachia satsuma]